MNKNPLETYRETQIKTASQGTLIVMLYDGAIRNINLALESLKEKPRKLDKISNYIIKAQDIITELIVSLDFEKGGEIAKNLFSLYVFMNRQLLDANITKANKPLEDVKKLLAELREAWAEIVKKGAGANNEKGSEGVNIAG
ncbi:MAG: flagellar export chaperone FliS [Spirochaetales bacterium]|nr:flagellar export chaperone FliS [Spirochaetales bacterium]RKX85316.1 MAG: flagellar export chaperone FliS [Spirochaetota bacterium]